MVGWVERTKMKGCGGGSGSFDFQNDFLRRVRAISVAGGAFIDR